jgi:hypothetical protein
MTDSRSGFMTFDTHATLLLKARVPIKVVSERLDHSTPGFTMATYQHVLPGMQAEAARTFAACSIDLRLSANSWARTFPRCPPVERVDNPEERNESGPLSRPF